MECVVFLYLFYTHAFRDWSGCHWETSSLYTEEVTSSLQDQITEKHPRLANSKPLINLIQMYVNCGKKITQWALIGL